MEKSNLESSNSFSLSPCNKEAGRPLRGRVGDGGISVSIDFVHQNNHFGRFRSQIAVAVVVVYPPRFRSQPCITVFARPAGGDRSDGRPPKLQGESQADRGGEGAKRRSESGSLAGLIRKFTTKRCKRTEIFKSFKFVQCMAARCKSFENDVQSPAKKGPQPQVV